MTSPIDPLGDGLSILIQCQPRQADAWLSFASWYSIKRNAPDAQVALSTHRPTSGQEQGICPWAYRLGVKSFFAENGAAVAVSRGYLSEPLLVIPAGAMVMESLPSALDDDVFDVKNPEPKWLVEVRESCGGFVMGRWIDTGGHPFRRTGAYQQGDLTVNERRVLSLWNQLCPIYDSIG